MSRVEENKLLKKKSLMDTAFQLFTSQGLGKTSIADIAQRAGVAKGTFYLYFKDKYDLHERLVVRKSEELFSHAMAHSGYETQTTPEDNILAIIDDILFQLRDDPLLLRFINKNLGWGAFRQVLDRSSVDYRKVITGILDDEAPDREELEIVAYTVLELVGASCYSVILEGAPADLEHYLPYLHRSVRAILTEFRQS